MAPGPDAGTSRAPLCTELYCTELPKVGSFESFLENYVISISDKESCSLLLVRVQQQVINRNCRNLSNKAVRPMAMIERGFVRSRQAEECCRTGDFVPNGQRRLTHALTTQIDPVEKPVLGPSDLSEASCPHESLNLAPVQDAAMQVMRAVEDLKAREFEPSWAERDREQWVPNDTHQGEGRLGAGQLA